LLLSSTGRSFTWKSWRWRPLLDHDMSEKGLFETIISEWLLAECSGHPRQFQIPKSAFNVSPQRQRRY
jgi:hypothetical protein